MATSSAAFQVLTAIAFGDAFDKVAIASGDTRNELLRLAERHRVQGLVAEALTKSDLDLTEDTRGWIEEHRRALGIAYLSRMAETARLAAHFADAGIEAIALKGDTLALALYAPHPALRQSIDIDLLVAPENFEKAERVLHTAGYTRDTPSPSIPASADSMARYLCNAYEYSHAEDGHQVELHHRLLGDPHAMAVPFVDLLANSETTMIGGRHVRSLGRDHLALYLCAHAAGHMFFRLKWLADIVRLFDRLDAEGIAHVVAKARLGRCEGPVLAAIALIEHLSDRRYACIGALERNHYAPLVKRAMSALSSPERADAFTLQDLPDDLAHFAFAWRLAPGWRSRAFAAMQHLVNHQDLATLKRGVAWAPLYAVLGRPLALARWLTRKPAA